MAKNCERTMRRNTNAVVEDLLFPGGDPDVTATSRRHEAIYEILTTMPDESYNSLKERADTFDWFIPDALSRGRIERWHARVYPKKKTIGRFKEVPYADILYLSPQLETAAWDIVLAVVAHELAHLAQNHQVICDADLYKKQEQEAWELVRRWGYAQQVKKLNAVHVRRDTVEKREIEESKAKIETAKARKQGKSGG